MDPAPKKPIPSRTARPCWIFVAVAAWNLLLAITFPIQGFYHGPLWLRLATEMIGLYPHLGYLLAWPFRQGPPLGFSRLPWDASEYGGILIVLTTLAFSLFLAAALYRRKRWASFIAAGVALLVAAVQYQQVQFLNYSWFGYKAHFNILSNAMGTGAFEKFLASLISSLLGLTLLRVLLFESQSPLRPAATPGAMDNRLRHRTAQILFWTLVASAFTLLILAGNTVSKSMSEAQRADSGFSVTFVLLSLVPISVAAAGLSITTNRFFIGLAIGYATLFPIILFETWFPELANPVSPISAIKAPVWIALLVCSVIVAASVAMLYLSRRPDSTHRGNCSLGFIVAIAFLAAALDACHGLEFLRR